MPNKSDSTPSVAATNNDDVAGELFSNKIAKESPLKDAAFNTSNSAAAAPTHTSKTLPWKMLLLTAAALVVAGLLSLLGWMYVSGKNQKQQSQAAKFNTASLDLASLNSGSLGNNATVLINGALTVNGPVTAQSFSGNGANLSDVDATKLDHQPGSYYLDASNLDAGTLNDARLSGNVVLLGSSPNFTNLLVTGTTTLVGPATLQSTLNATGAVTFQSNLSVGGNQTVTGNTSIGGELTVTGDTNINGLTYNWPGTQASGVLSNDGAGNLAWQPVGACASCITDGGNAFGTSISVGTNDANNLILKTNGTGQVTIDTTGQVGIGNGTPGYKLDVNGDVNVAAGNAFRIGGTAICTSGGCAASAGSTDYVQNSASLQTGVNFNFEIASINSVGGIIRAKAGQVADLQQWQSSGGVALASLNSSGQLSFGDSSSNLNTYAFIDTTDFQLNNSNGDTALLSTGFGGALSLTTGINSANLDAVNGLSFNGTTVCTIAGCTAAGGSGSYIQNGTSLQTTANFNFQSAAAGSVGGIIRGAVGQTANLQEWQDSNGNMLTGVDATGALVFSALNTGYNALSLGSGAPYGWSGGLALQDPTDSWGPGATILSPGEIDIMGNKNWPSGDHNGISLYTSGSTTGSAVIQLYGMGQSQIQLRSNDNTNLGSITLDSAGVLDIYSSSIGLTGTTTVYSQSTSVPTFSIKAIGSQTGDLTRWLSSAGSTLAAVDVGGRFIAPNLGSADTSTYLCRNSSNQIASCSGSASGAAFVQGGNSFGATASLGTNDNNLLAFETNGTEKMRLTTGGVLEINSTGAPGTVEKFRVNTPTTADNAANAIITTSATTSKGLVIQGLVSQSANLQEWQNSSGTALAYVNSAGDLFLSHSSGFASIGGIPAQSGQIRITNGGFITARNAANTADVTIARTTGSDGFVFGSGSGTMTFDVTGKVTLGGGSNPLWFDPATRSIGWTGGGGLNIGDSTTSAKSVSFVSNVDITSQSAAAKGLVVKGAASQSANLQEWQDSTGASVAVVTPAGASRFGATTSGAGSLQVYAAPGSSLIALRDSANSNAVVFGVHITGDQGVLTIGSNASDYLNGATRISGVTSQSSYFNNGGALGVGTATVAGTVQRFGVYGYTTVDNAAASIFATGGTANKGIVVQGAASQSANLQEWQNSAGTVLSKVDANGVGYFGNGTTSLTVGVTGTPSAPYVVVNGGNLSLRSGNGTSTLIYDESGVIQLQVSDVAGANGYALLPQKGGVVSAPTGTVEKFRVIAPTTVDNSANVMFSTSATTSKGLVIQGVASQTASLLELQSSTGSSVFKVGPGGGVSIGTNPALTGSLNLPNNADIRWRNAANTADLGMKLTVSNNIQFATNIEIGLAQPSTTGALRLQNNDNIGWRNAANSGNYSLGVNSSDVLTYSGSDFAFGSTPSTLAGALRLPNLTLVSWRNAANSGNVWLGPNASSDDTLYYSGTSITLAGGTNTASSGALRLQNNTSVSWRNAANTGNIGLAVNSGDNLTTGAVALILGNGGTPASSGALRLNNNTNVSWRNAANTGDITAGVNTSDIFQVTSPAADANDVAQFNNAGATNCTVQPGGTGFACSSDARLKTNIMNLESADATELVNKLQGVSFNWITNPDGQTQVGFIAQDLMKYIPSAVSQDSTGHYVANYTAIIPYLVEAFKKQQTQIDTLNTQTGTSVDVLKQLADAKAVTLSGDLTVGGNVVVKGRIEASSDNTGSVTIPAGQTSVHVALPSAFSKKPNINLTPGDFIDGQHRVTNITRTGFTIELQKAQTDAVNFDWQAL